MREVELDHLDDIDLDRLSPKAELYQRSPAPSMSRFRVADLDDIEIGAEPVSLIDGLLTSTGLAVVFGVPKSGKSFVISDALFHVAMGRPWAGREVLQGAVAFVTCEGVNGFKRRLIAMRRHYGVEGQGVPFGMISVAPDLGHTSGDDVQLIEAIREWLASKGNPPLRAIAIDTLARAMKGADENAAKDIAILVDNCGRIAEAFGCLVVVVHHAGKDTARGSRGSNALDGAADVMWSVEKGEGVSTVSIHAMKDGEEGISWQFRLAPYVFDEAPAGGGATWAQHPPARSKSSLLLSQRNTNSRTATKSWPIARSFSSTSLETL